MTTGDARGGAFALIVATDTYQDSRLVQLRSPARDAEELAGVLTDPKIGGYQVQSFMNEQTHLLNEEIEGFFADRLPQDTLLLYLSCHGVKDVDGRLRFATKSTKMNRLAATAISAEFVYEQVDRSRAQNVLVLLDCCYSGSYLRGHRARSVDRADIGALQGRGRAVITSSTSVEYSFEIDTGRVEGAPVASVFTAAIIEGLRTGQADRDGDGLVSVDDLYGYVFESVRERTPHQTPEKKWGDIRGDFIVARNPYPPADIAEPLPPELAEALNSPYSRVRVGAVEELTSLARGSHPGIARTASETLKALVADDSKLVSSAAQRALAALSQPETSRAPAAQTASAQPDPEDRRNAHSARNSQGAASRPPGTHRTSQADGEGQRPAHSAPAGSRAAGGESRKPLAMSVQDRRDSPDGPSSFADWDPQITKKARLLVVYLIPFITLEFAFLVLPILALSRDRLVRMNAIQSFLICLTAAPAIGFSIAANLVTTPAPKVFWAIFAALCGITTIGLQFFCIARVRVGEQPRLRVLTRVAYTLAYGRTSIEKSTKAGR